MSKLRMSASLHRIRYHFMASNMLLAEHVGLDFCRCFGQSDYVTHYSICVTEK
jgi:hypothetical protein